MKQKILPLLVFAALASYLLLMFYSEMLLTAQLRTPFLAGELFRDAMLSMPFGWMSYAGCWLTQHFYHPAVGVGLLLLIWLATWAAGRRALGLSGSWSVLLMLPLGCLVLSVTDVGYWIYCLKMPGYWFAQSLGYMLCLLLWWGMSLMKRSVLSDATQAVAALLLYPLIGWYAYVLALGLLLQRRNLWMLAMAVAPLLWHSLLYAHCPMREVWLAGFPVFDNNAIVTWRPSVPFVVLALLTVAFAAAPWRKALSTKQWSIALIAVTAVTATSVWMGSFKDYNYIAEMRMTRQAMSDDWQGVMTEAKKAVRPSRTMVALKNVALLNLGQLGSKSFALGNVGREITNPDSVNVDLMYIASPVVYYNYGMTNYADRWCVESAVAYGYSPFALMQMTRCALAADEPRLANRYLKLLHGMTYYADWQPGEVSSMVHTLRGAFADVIDSDYNNCERYLTDIFSRAQGSADPVVQELNLFYAMLQGDPARFWPAFATYAAAHRQAALPQHYQEAYVLYSEYYPMQLPYAVNVQPVTRDNYQAFKQHYLACQQAGADMPTTAEAMREQWGKTFWWYQFFGRKK